MKIFLTGATGYIGGTVAARLIAAGHQVTGLVRSAAGEAALRERGVVPLRGELADRGLLADAARRADAVINAANSDNRDVIETVLPALHGSGKPFIQTSGSSIVGDKAGGTLGTRIYDEETPVTPLPEKAPRVAINSEVLASAKQGVRAIVLCPSLIYGTGAGIHRKSVAQAISRMLGMDGTTEEWPLEAAIKAWGRETAEFTFASNSRVRAAKARRMLDWSPQGPPLLLDIEHGSYRRAQAA